MDFQLTDDGDLDVTGGLSLVDGTAAIAQHVGIRLRFVKGEWFLDDRIGFPYFDRVLVKNPNIGMVASLMRKTISETPGIASVDNLELSFDSETRRAAVSFTATCDDGSPLEFKEFIL